MSLTKNHPRSHAPVVECIEIEEVGMRVRFTIYWAKEHVVESTQSGVVK